MQIAIVYNARPEGLDRDDPSLEQFIEGDERKTVEAVGKAIESYGHSVSYLTVDENLYQKLAKVSGEIDLIFNMAEGMAHIKDREAQLPMIAEMLQIPHTGPKTLEAALILDKYRAKQIWHASGVATATAKLLENANTPLLEGVQYPLLVKPNGDGSGVGIHENSVIKNKNQLRLAVEKINKQYRQPALVEKYLSGREFTVAIVGNGAELTVLPIIEINFEGLPQDAPAIDSYKAKFIYGATGVVPMDKTEICPAKISPELEDQIVDLAKRAYVAIGCADFGRVDIRLDEKGRPFVLEINHPPGLMSDPNESSFFTISARAYGWDFRTLIGKILESAIKRLAI